MKKYSAIALTASLFFIGALLGCNSKVSQNLVANASSPENAEASAVIQDEKLWKADVEKNFKNFPAVMKIRLLDVSPSGTAQYDDLRELDRAYMLLRQGKKKEALEIFNRLAAIGYPEETNFAPLAGQAEAYCSLGQMKLGLKSINNLQCEHDLYSSKKTCDQLDKEVKANKPDFPAQCYEDICDSAFIRPYLEEEQDDDGTPPGSFADEYQDYLNSLKKQCGA